MQGLEPAITIHALAPSYLPIFPRTAHQLNQPLHMSGRGMLQNAMTEIENMPASGESCKDYFYPLGKLWTTILQKDGIKIALNHTKRL